MTLNYFGHSKLLKRIEVLRQMIIYSIKTLFQRIFPEEVSEKFSLGHTNIPCIVRHELNDVLFL